MAAYCGSGCFPVQWRWFSEFDTLHSVSVVSMHVAARLCRELNTDPIKAEDKEVLDRKFNDDDNKSEKLEIP